MSLFFSECVNEPYKGKPFVLRTVRELRPFFQVRNPQSPAISGFLQKTYQEPFVSCRYTVARIETFPDVTPPYRSIRRYLVRELLKRELSGQWDDRVRPADPVIRYTLPDTGYIQENAMAAAEKLGVSRNRVARPARNPARDPDARVNGNGIAMAGCTKTAECRCPQGPRDACGQDFNLFQAGRVAVMPVP